MLKILIFKGSIGVHYKNLSEHLAKSLYSEDIKSGNYVPKFLDNILYLFNRIYSNNMHNIYLNLHAANRTAIVFFFKKKM